MKNKFGVILISVAVLLASFSYTADTVYAAESNSIEITDLSNEYQSVQSSFGFNAFYLRVTAKNPTQTSINVSVASSKDNLVWSMWQPFKIQTNLILTDTKSSTDYYDDEFDTRLMSGKITTEENVSYLRIKFLNREQVQDYKVIFEGGQKLSNRPTTQEVTPTYDFSYLDLPIITRAGWGCPNNDPESLSYCAYPDWHPQYPSKITHIMVHHTATTNAATNWAAEVRSVWYHHAHGRGWTDIGYNFLIDPNGLIYEGRYGGETVVAGHTLDHNWGSIGISMLGTFTDRDVTIKAREALHSLIFKLSHRYSIDMDRIAADAVGGINYRLTGHRDWAQTACPGGIFYSKFGPMRQLGYKEMGKVHGDIPYETQ